jgi:dienelactone hydrolase
VDMYDQPKSKGLYSSELPHDARYITHDFKGYSTEARIVYNASHDAPWVISMHGAKGDFTKNDLFTLGLRDRGYSVLSMTLSGHSPASGIAPEDTSLGNNMREAEAYFEYLDPRRKKVVIGYSMGGTSALNLLRKHGDDIEKLILFYPGVYDAAAYEKHFGPEFKAAISRPFSYRDNDVIELLRSFPGKVLLIVGEYDGLDPVAYGKPAGGSVGQFEHNGQVYYSPIPKEVIDSIRSAIPQGQGQYIEVPGCDHVIAPRLREQPKKAAELLDRIDAFLSDAR